MRAWDGNNHTIYGLSRIIEQIIDDTLDPVWHWKPATHSRDVTVDDLHRLRNALVERIDDLIAEIADSVPIRCCQQSKDSIEAASRRSKKRGQDLLVSLAAGDPDIIDRIERLLEE